MKVRFAYFLAIGVALACAVVVTSCAKPADSAGSCTGGQSSCGGKCVNLSSDSTNCGACGMKCAAGSSCSAGMCGTCGSGFSSCGNQCVNTTADVSNCGSCNHVCGSNQSCGNGNCTCPGGLLSCGQACVDSATDVRNCGTCNTACQPGQQCTGSKCQCLGGLMACGTACASLMSDPAHCGDCNTVCVGGQVCNMGKCAASCTGGLTTCTGACVMTNTDPLNCGRCGNVCPAGQACAAGACGCPIAGQTLCGTACVDTKVSASNCGGCGNPCLGGQVCANGACACPAGQSICNGSCVATGQCGGTGGAGGGGGGTGGAGGNSARPPGCPAAAGVLSDFEEGSGFLVNQGGRTGWWYVFQETPAIGGATLTPPANNSGAIAAAMLPAAEQTMCNKWALHSTAGGHTMYVGTGATLAPVSPTSMTKNPVDISTYNGVSFKIRSGSGSAPPILFEFLNKETQPAAGSGTATNNSVDAYNTRGKLLNGIGTAWQTVYVPYGLLAPRYLPSTACAAGVFCEAPAFNPKSTLGLQFSLYNQFTTMQAYDLWIDDVTLYTGDQGLSTLPQTTGTFKFPQDKAVGSCTKPTGAAGKFLVDAYLRWKQTFVTATGAGSGLRVRRPENGDDTVSEGIAYGMLIAVYMNDRDLFDKLWTYWSSHIAIGSLMNWQINSGGGNIGGGSAVDADEDAAFALLQAGKQWGGSYAATALTVIQSIWNNEVETGSLALKPGNNFGGAGLTNPSYFAPAYYRIFKTVDAGHNWDGVITTAYAYLNKIAGGNGLVPAWCSNSCGSPGGGGYTDAEKYQYDSHRTPWRIGLDACWNNNADARAYVAKTSNFFSGLSVNGIGTIVDIYLTGGTANTGSKSNSMSAVGTAAVGAMVTAGSNAGHKRFLDSAYRFLLDAVYTPDPQAQLTAYTYFNATVGLLTALTLSGNFNNF
jgi:endo-1,4-beta-D-glucanase Y